MKKIKNEDGAITILVVISILFMISFLISSYTIIANRVKTQKEIIAETKKIYEPNLDAEEIYNSYLNNSNIVPIYTTEQLFMMGQGNENININGKYYNFDNNENTIYILMNNLKFKASDYANELTDGYWQPIGERILKYENLTNEELSNQELINGQFKAKFEGKNNTIEVIYTDEEDDDYSVVYSKENNYCEPEYEVTVTPKFLDGTIANEAKILLDNIETEFIGQSIIKIKRKKLSKVSAYIDDTFSIPEQDVLIVNPNKIRNIDLTIDSNGLS